MPLENHVLSLLHCFYREVLKHSTLWLSGRAGTSGENTIHAELFNTISQSLFLWIKLEKDVLHGLKSLWRRDRLQSSSPCSEHCFIELCQVSSNYKFFYYSTDVCWLQWNHQKGQKLECPYKLNCLLKLMIITYVLQVKRGLCGKNRGSPLPLKLCQWQKNLRLQRGCPTANFYKP